MVKPSLTNEEAKSICSIIDGTLDSMDEVEDPEEFQTWLKILRKLGGSNIADEWESSLEEEGIL